ncbi:dihydroxy-acid dehydratase [Cohnella silvisoli]|uniref:Dihydroxy-acid dehydratase n=1 Tax=Cohnella silvisoli TaxID=2873699 RepID=A0ABV1KND1_9BACL|nr:dihydroxy-acid dehydratase [Cohnella silvisoli]MCD9020336.1 dihydroxy-acid dehydratase [Cohnella silvisoli]
MQSMILRSQEWFDGRPDHSFEHRSSMRAMGHLPESYMGKPIIGIFNSWNDFTNCNLPHKQLVEYVKRGVLMAGGYPMEMHSISTPSDFMKPSDLPYRNLMSMDIEEMIRSLPIDGAIHLCECDKTTPAQLMAAASCDIPAIQLAAGHRASAYMQGKAVNYGTDTWKYLDDYNAGLVSEQQWQELETNISCSLGGCPVMGTASTMKSLSEMLGMMLPGTASIPAHHAARYAAAEMTGRRIVEMVREGLHPSLLMTEAAFHNAIKLLAALGGSSNAVIHLTAIAGRLGIRLGLDAYADQSRNVPLLVNLQPSGIYNMDQFHVAGGIGAAIKQLLPLLDCSALAATGKTIAEEYGQYEVYSPEVIASLDQPVKEFSGFVVFRGSLAPDGAILKRAASSLNFDRFIGKAVVFEDYADMLARINDDDLDVREDSVLLMKNCGPIGAGMPEWGMIPIPNKLLKLGVRDMVRISDARMSGTSYGTVILHASPESALGGPLAIVQDGDEIEVDLPNGIINLRVDDKTMEDRLARWQAPSSPHKRGFMRIYEDQVLQAHEGCDFWSLRPKDRSEVKLVPPIVGRG